MRQVISYGGLTRWEKERYKVCRFSRMGFLKEPVDAYKAKVCQLFEVSSANLRLA